MDNDCCFRGEFFPPTQPSVPGTDEPSLGDHDARQG